MAGEESKRPNGGSYATTKLDLFNFDSLKHRNSRYILTSPRSLKACSRLGIKPVELLPQTLQEFSVSSAGLGLHRGMLESVYRESEILRKKKLQVARREREKIIAGEGGEGRRSEVDGGGHFRSREERSSKANAFSDTVLPTAALTNKDQRILTAMANHMAEEERQAVLREKAEWARHVERERERRIQEEKELAHQRRMAESQRRFKKQVDSLKQIHRSLAEEEGRERQLQYDAKWERWSESSQLQASLRAEKIAAKKHQELKRKHLQEQRLKELQREEELQQESVREHLSWLESRAAANRETITERETKEKQVRHRAERVRHERRREEISAQMEEEREVMRSSLADRHKQAVERYHAQCEMRRSQIKHAGDEESRRQAECKLRSEMMEGELEQWREEVDAYNRRSMTRAKETAQELIEGRRREIQAKRLKKERELQDKFRWKELEDLERRAQYAAEMEMKRERSEAVMREREMTLQKSREVASASAKLRDQVKDHYLRNSFDRMAQRAEMQAALENKQPKTLTNTKNRSKLILA